MIRSAAFLFVLALVLSLVAPARALNFDLIAGGSAPCKWDGGVVYHIADLFFCWNGGLVECEQTGEYSNCTPSHANPQRLELCPTRHARRGHLQHPSSDRNAREH